MVKTSNLLLQCTPFQLWLHLSTTAIPICTQFSTASLHQSCPTHNSTSLIPRLLVWKRKWAWRWGYISTTAVHSFYLSHLSTAYHQRTSKHLSSPYLVTYILRGVSLSTWVGCLSTCVNLQLLVCVYYPSHLTANTLFPPIRCCFLHICNQGHAS